MPPPNLFLLSSDGEGNVTSQNGLAYAYDGLDRLISAQVPGASGGTRTVAYAYDRVGNRLSETWDGGAPKTYTYSPGNYLTQAGGMRYSYGAFGELRQKQASDTTTEYIYDGSRRMAQVKTGGTEVARYIYDALGRRISATSGGVTRVSLYLGNDIVYEVDGTAVTKYLVAGGKYLAKVVTQAQAGAAGTLGAAAVVTLPVEPPDGSTSRSTSTKTPPGYIPPPDDPIMIIEPPIIYPPPPDEPPGEEPPPQEPPPSEPQPPSSYGVFYFHTDLVGSIRAVTDSQGQVVARYEYEPFGLTVKSEGPLAGQDVHKFTGKPEDAAIGLYYFGARYYDPEAGRFTSRDLARQGINWYVYCNNNPLRLVDPDGAFPRPAVLQHGIDIHTAIELDVRARYPSFRMEVRWEFGGESGRVDLVDHHREEEGVLEAYEIKSLTVRGVKEGAAQLAREMRGLAGATGMRTVPGCRSLAGITSTDRHLVFYFSVPGTGLILYQAIDRQRAGATLALAAIVGVAATVIEDIVTGGAGIVDDPLTVGACMALLGLEDQAGPVSAMTSGYYQGRYRVEVD